MKLSLRLGTADRADCAIWKRLSPEIRFAMLGFGLVDFEETSLGELQSVAGARLKEGPEGHS